MLGYVLARQPTVISREFQRDENVNAWICAQRATDRDLESFLRMLGYALVRQPTVILRVSSSREK